MPVLWLEKQHVKAAILHVKATILHFKAAILHVKAAILHFKGLYCMFRRLYWFSVELEASLAPAKAEVGAVAKADQN